MSAPDGRYSDLDFTDTAPARRCGGLDGGEWLTPGHVTDRIRAARRDISRRIFTRDITPPAELGGDLQAELRWRRETVPAIIDRHLDDWARTGALPEPTSQLDPVSAVGQARLAELLGRTRFASAVTR